MAEKEVDQYFGLAADNMEYVFGLVQRLHDALGNQNEINPKYLEPRFNSAQCQQEIRSLFEDYEYQSTLTAAAAIHGLKEEDYFCDAALELLNRHIARNRLNRLFSHYMCLRRESPLRNEIVMLLKKMGKKYTTIRSDTKSKEN